LVREHLCTHGVVYTRIGDDGEFPPKFDRGGSFKKLADQLVAPLVFEA
jgi:hypothetical protein